MKPALRVVAPGLMTTLQDLGRSGYQHLGIPVSGALDAVALRAANAIVGNPPGMGALEIAYQGPALAVAAASARVAYAGGNAAIEVEIRGNTTAGIYGLMVNSQNNTIRGLAIFNFNYQILLRGSRSHNNHVEGNFIGTNAAQTSQSDWAGQNDGLHMDRSAE